MDADRSIVIELQQLASESNEEIADLLRKAFVVASKLQLNEHLNWIQKEMNGYENGADVPDYRRLTSQLKVRNPYHGLQPFVIDDDSLMAAICTLFATQPVGELSQLTRKNTDGILFFPFQPGQLQTLMAMQQQAVGLTMEPVRIIANSQICGILDAVRNRILEWSLRLEA